MTIVVIYVLAAILPAVFLMRYIYRLDRSNDKEPAGLLWKLVLSGVYAAGLAMVLEILTDNFVIPSLPLRGAETLSIVEAVFVGFIEEGSKLFFLKKRTWHNPNFNYLFDGVVYAVFVSLGFAALENILYVFHYGLSVALSRAVFAIAGHFGFSVLMGTMYARGKYCDTYGDSTGARANLWLGYLLAAGAHSFYDATAMISTSTATVLFLIFVALLYVLTYRLVHEDVRHDQPIY
jgi:RsiW-degrading membrane proteinase PrsW (M82 family)